MTTPTPLPENKIIFHDILAISPLVGPEVSLSNTTLTDDQFQWWVNAFSAPPESEIEIKERDIAVMEQLNKGIIHYDTPKPPEPMMFGDFVPHTIASNSAPVLPRKSSPIPEKLSSIFKKTKIGPNEPCPCGKGKKYKKCCGRGL